MKIKLVERGQQYFTNLTILSQEEERKHWALTLGFKIVVAMTT